MKRILTAAIILTLASCEGHIKTEKTDYIELGNVKTRLEIRKQDGKYVPAAKPVNEAVFNEYFPGTWKLFAIRNVAYTGDLEEVPFSYADGNNYPFFAVKEDGKIRQYIDTPALKTFKDGSYTYDGNTGIIHFKDVVEKHPEFRVVTMKDTEMHGTFTDESNNSDKSVMTLYVYKKLSYLDAAGLDSLFGVE